MASQLFKRADTMRISTDVGTKSKERQIHEYTFEYNVVPCICTVYFIIYISFARQTYLQPSCQSANHRNLAISTCHIMLTLHVYYVTFVLGGGATVQTTKPVVGHSFPSLHCNIISLKPLDVCLETSGSRCFKPRCDLFRTLAK